MKSFLLQNLGLHFKFSEATVPSVCENSLRAFRSPAASLSNKKSSRLKRKSNARFRSKAQQAVYLDARHRRYKIVVFLPIRPAQTSWRCDATHQSQLRHGGFFAAYISEKSVALSAGLLPLPIKAVNALHKACIATGFVAQQRAQHWSYARPSYGISS